MPIQNDTSPPSIWRIILAWMINNLRTILSFILSYPRTYYMVTRRLTFKDLRLLWAVIIEVITVFLIYYTILVAVFEATTTRSGKWLFKARINTAPSKNRSLFSKRIIEWLLHAFKRKPQTYLPDAEGFQLAASNLTVSHGPVDIKLPNSCSKLVKDTGIYAPLVESTIRLLRISPSEERTAAVKADLIRRTIFSAQSKNYRALSYTWGRKEASIPITVNGKVVLVPPNLDRILRTLRALRYEYIWVDAICINQADDAERSAQVPRMRAIYAGAQQIIVATEAGTMMTADRLTQLLAPIEPNFNPASPPTGFVHALQEESTFSALESFCIDPYWKRIWIIQEFSIGHDVQLLIGDRTIAASKLQSLLEMLDVQGKAGRLKQAHSIYEIRSKWQSGASMKLLPLLELTASSLCTIRHDRVFGLHGISTDALKYLPETNYETNVATTTVAITRAYIQRDVLDIILLAPHVSQKDIPSWAPNLFDFDQFPPESRVISLISSDHPESRWSATGTVPSNVSFLKQSLLTSAGPIGSIRSLGKAWHDPVGSEFPTHEENWTRDVSSSKLCKELYEIMLETLYVPNSRSEGWCKSGASAYETFGYSFVRVFLPSHGDPDPEMAHSDLVGWIYSNREFFTGKSSLAKSAEQLQHPFLIPGVSAWNASRWEFEKKGKGANRMWARMERMAMLDMRLMCLDAGPEHRIGWAAKGARLHDEVFLIPGCSSPVILRKRPDAKYEVVGDAIVTGAMEGELWERYRTQGVVQNIEIV